MNENKRRQYVIMPLLALLFLALPAVSANIDIIDVGTGYDGIDYYGFVDYRNTADFNLSGTLSVYIDGDVVAERALNMPIRYLVGFRCSSIKTLEFPLNMSKGEHTIVVYALSQNIGVERVYEYSMEGWEDELPYEEETELGEVEEEWLFCWGYEE